MLAHELMKNIQAFSTSMERMASGLKINSAKDDPSGFYISSKFTTQINGLTVANNNIQNAIDILGQADESLKEIDELLGKMRDLIESSCSEYLTPSEREENQKKINAYFQQALQIKDETEVDGRKIFSEKISLDKNVTYTDGHAVTEAGNALAASFVDDSTPAAQPASMPVVDSGTDSGVDNGVAAADFVDTGMAAYSPEDEWGAAYSPEDDYGSLYDESAYSDDEEETAFVFDDGVQNAGIAMADKESDGIACYSGEEDPNAGISIASETGNDGIAVASTIVDSGSVTVAGGETKTITIGDKTYRIYGGYDEWGSSPNASSGGTINWSIDEDGQITFSSDDKSSDHETKGLTVYATDGQNDNVSIDGNICFYAGDLDDTIIVKKGVFASYILAGDGNDSIVNNGTIHHCIHADESSDGNDTIINNGQVGGYIWAYGGDDYLVNNGNIEWTLDGDSGNDTVVYSVNSSVGGALSSPTNGNIRGVENFEATNPTFGTITQNGTYTIDDKTYTVSDLSGSIDWSVEDGVITFSGNTATITAADGQADNVSIDGLSSISFEAGDMNDTIIINENSKAESINAGDGDDEIINYGYISTTLGLDSGNDIVWNYGGISGSLYGQEGDDTIINAADAYVSTIIGSDGNDSIVNNGVIQYATSVGYGNDTIINNGTMGIGTDTSATGNIYVENNENGYLTSLGLGNGNDYVINKGTITSSIFLGVGNDTIYDYGDGYLGLDAGDGDDYLYIYSEGNHIYGYHGNDYIYIHGNDNHVDGNEGDDMIFVYSDGNEIAGGGGSDDIMISGDNNIAYGSSSSIGGTNDEFNTITTSGKNNTYSGFDELNNGNQSMNIQTDWNINDYSSYTLNLDLFLPEIEFDISTAENAQLSLTQLDEIIKGLSTSRTSIGAQNLILEEQLNHNTIRMSNIKNSRSIIRDADTAEEYNNLITQASMVQQIQTLHAQANSNHYNLVSQLIYGVVA